MSKTKYNILFAIILSNLSSIEMKAQQAVVNVQQDSTITRLMEIKKQIDFETYAASYFTIQLFYGDNKRAQELLENLKVDFPDYQMSLVSCFMILPSSIETPPRPKSVGSMNS